MTKIIICVSVIRRAIIRSICTICILITFHFTHFCFQYLDVNNILFRHQIKDMKKEIFNTQSSISEKVIQIIYISNYSFISYKMKFLPVQLCPSPVYPLLQLQLCDPSVFVHFALTSHPPWFFKHSLISKRLKVIT